MTYGKLSGRTTSAFPLSIATSLSLESLFVGRGPTYDPKREIPNYIDVKNYNEIWINCATLIRNISGAIDSKEYALVNDVELFEALLMEMEIIESIFKIEGAGVCIPRFYYCDYKAVYTKHYHQAVRLRQDSTDIQKHHSGLMMLVMERLKKHFQTNLLLRLDSDLRPPHRAKALIFTHIPHDLLSYPNFEKLDLLESHTGKLKPRNLWYTKFFKLPNSELNTIPFNQKFLLIFGDHVIYVPMDIRFRRMLVDISVQRRWTPLTTLEKVTLDLSLDLKDPYLVEMFKAL